jgi:hypothetical protein
LLLLLLMDQEGSKGQWYGWHWQHRLLGASLDWLTDCVAPACCCSLLLYRLVCKLLYLSLLQPCLLLLLQRGANSALLRPGETCCGKMGV